MTTDALDAAQPSLDWAAIHGRFQPFHLGHFAYLRRAFRLAHTVVVGITNPVPHRTTAETTDPRRHLAANNPLTYFERLEIITAAIVHHDAALLRRVRIVPFDVNADPSTYRFAIPLHVTQVVAPYEAWDREKARRFAAVGYRVVEIPTVIDRLTATHVRAALRAGDDSWRRMVPPGVDEVMDALGVTARMTGNNDRMEDARQ
jgi:cytidyltransferase-like protein